MKRSQILNYNGVVQFAAHNHHSTEGIYICLPCASFYSSSQLQQSFPPVRPWDTQQIGWLLPLPSPVWNKTSMPCVPTLWPGKPRMRGCSLMWQPSKCQVKAVYSNANPKSCHSLYKGKRPGQVMKFCISQHTFTPQQCQMYFKPLTYNLFLHKKVMIQVWSMLSRLGPC